MQLGGCARHLKKIFNSFILEAVKAWVNLSQKEKRAMHDQDNGTFKANGKLIALRDWNGKVARIGWLHTIQTALGSLFKFEYVLFSPTDGLLSQN